MMKENSLESTNASTISSWPVEDAEIDDLLLNPFIEAVILFRCQL